jgi:enamine deaminase RidA (YjgF/YER057c/UK114 family)
MERTRFVTPSLVLFFTKIEVIFGGLFMTAWTSRLAKAAAISALAANGQFKPDQMQNVERVAFILHPHTQRSLPMTTSVTTPEAKLEALGLKLPKATKSPEGLHLPFTFVNIRGERLLFSGHPKNAIDGSIAGPFGVVGSDISTEQGYAEAREVALTVLANIKAEVGELSRIVGWVRVFGMVTSAPGYSDQHIVVNGFSDLVIEVFGQDVGRHARSAIGVAGLPLGFAMEIEGEVLIGK